jgi:hypothetical protein
VTTNRTPLERPSRHHLTHDEEMSLCFGELRHWPAFADDATRKAAWFVHRARLLEHCSWGKRPAGWWDYECPIERPRDRDYEEAALFEAGLLTQAEIDELTAKWRTAFERAQDPQFMYRAVEGWLDGARAKKAFFRWSGIPKALIREWVREHRRPRKLVREREAVSAAEPPAVA